MEIKNDGIIISADELKNTHNELIQQLRVVSPISEPEKYLKIVKQLESMNLLNSLNGESKALLEEPAKETKKYSKLIWVPRTDKEIANILKQGSQSDWFPKKFDPFRPALYTAIIYFGFEFMYALGFRNRAPMEPSISPYEFFTNIENHYIRAIVIYGVMLLIQYFRSDVEYVVRPAFCRKCEKYAGNILIGKSCECGEKYEDSLQWKPVFMDDNSSNKSQENGE